MCHLTMAGARKNQNSTVDTRHLCQLGELPKTSAVEGVEAKLSADTNTKSKAMTVAW